MSIKLEFPANDKRAAKAFGRALLELCGASYELPGELAETVSNEQEPGPLPPPATNEQPDGVDHNGVPFNGEYCGKSKDPFYSNGPQAGQWKKRRGLEQSAYDAWYVDELAKLQGDTPAETEKEDVNTASAFGGPPQPPADNVNQSSGPDSFPPFIQWHSEQVNAGRVTNDTLNEAYEAVGIVMTDLFPPTPPEQIAVHIDKVVHYLVAAGAEPPQ